MASTSEQLRRWQAKQSINQTVYKAKKIHFLEKDIPIILQNKNGPCPLIAICNVLLLRGKYDLSADVTRVSEGQLLTFVAENLYNSLKKDENGKNTVADAIDLTPSLTAGMIVDVKFTRIDDFELTRENGVFGLLGIRLVHGWLVDPQDTETSKAIGSMSFNTLMDELVIHQFLQNLQDFEPVSVKKSKEDNVEVEHLETIAEFISLTTENSDGVISEPTSNVVESSERMKETIAESSSLTTTNADGVISEPTSNVAESSKKMKEAIAESGSSASTSDVNEGELIKCFLDNNPSQLTVYGLFCLQAGLEEQELCVFFRNNHFNTMLKYLGELYILVTDEGYMDQPGVVWEKLIEVNGDTVFVNSNFKIFNPGDHEIEEIPASDLKSDKKKESDVKSVKKKDLATVMKEFEDHLEGLEGGSAFNPIVEKALELLGIDEKELLYGPEVEEISESEEKSVKEKPDKKSMNQIVEEQFEQIIKESSRFSPDVVKLALKLLGLDDTDIFSHLFPDLPEVENPRPNPKARTPSPQPNVRNPRPSLEPKPGVRNPGPEPKPKQNKLIPRRPRISPKKAKQIIKEKCYLM